MALDELDGNVRRIMASDGEEGIMKLSLYSEEPPDFIFLDLNMPRMNGLECLREIKTFAHLRNTKVVIYSTTDLPEVRELTKALGADDFLVKPSSVVKLVEFLSELFAVKSNSNEK